MSCPGSFLAEGTGKVPSGEHRGGGASPRCHGAFRGGSNNDVPLYPGQVFTKAVYTKSCYSNFPKSILIKE